MEKRVLGRTGESLSVIGFGAIVFVNEGPDFADQAVARAIDEGVNYFDIGPRYGNGEGERRAGPALKPYRDQIFLAQKTAERTRDAAATQLRQSLKRMGTDYFDLYQFHAVHSMEEVQAIIGPGGALEAFVAAKDQGLIRYLGFSAHSEEAALLLMDQFEFDAILYPVNYVCWYQGQFGPAVIEKAQQKGMGILALKALAKQPWPEGKKERWIKPWYAPVESYEEACTALRWTLSRPVTSCVCPGHAEFLWWMIDAEKQIVSLTPDEEQRIALATDQLAPIFQSPQR